MKSYLDNWEKVLGVRRAKRIFVAATRQNVGKTTVCLGLISILRQYFKEIGFIKPVGQHYLEIDGNKVDEDSILIERIFNFKFSLKDMSPVAIEKNYTTKFLDGHITVEDGASKVRRAFDRVAQGKELMIIEGTGHAGVGSVFDLSNAAVAKMLNSKVIMVSQGGIGRPIDEIILNKSLFDKKGVKVAGVIVNKVLPEKYEKIKTYASKGLERLGIPVLGVIPYIDLLEKPTMCNIKEEMEMHMLCGEKKLDNQVREVLVGAMDSKEAEKYIKHECLLITPGNREDLLNLLIKIHRGRYKYPKKISGIILSGGLVPKRRMYNSLKQTGIPVLMSHHDTYAVASMVHDLTVKIKSRDMEKVRLAMDTIKKYVDVERVIKNLT